MDQLIQGSHGTGISIREGLFKYMNRELEDMDETERWKIDEEGDEDENWPKPPEE